LHISKKHCRLVSTHRQKHQW